MSYDKMFGWFNTDYVISDGLQIETSRDETKIARCVYKLNDHIKHLAVNPHMITGKDKCR